MRIVEPPYILLDMECNEWRFHESQEIVSATQKFDSLLEWNGSSSKFGVKLQKFLQKHPNHIDGLHHYGSHLSHSGQYLEGLAFSQTAVATGMRAFPKEFLIGRDRLPTGFTSNRPFLRALHGLMLAQRRVGLLSDAIKTGESCLTLDREDRMGARETLVIYYLENHREKAALDLFENAAYKNTFGCAEYVHALVLSRLAREEESRSVLREQLRYYPQVARFVLNPRLPQPPNDSILGGVIYGSEYEGWMNAQFFGFLWRKSRAAMKILREESRPFAANGWKRWQKKI